MKELLPDYKKGFTKWNNNNGFLNQDQFSATLDAFTHWTYAITKGYLMVVDLQGVEQEKKFILTDPSIHCKAPKYGNTNCGEVGMKQFLKTHKCGSVCIALELNKNENKKHSSQKKILGIFRKVEKKVVEG